MKVINIIIKETLNILAICKTKRTIIILILIKICQTIKNTVKHNLKTRFNMYYETNVLTLMLLFKIYLIDYYTRKCYNFIKGDIYDKF